MTPKKVTTLKPGALPGGSVSVPGREKSSNVMVSGLDMGEVSHKAVIMVLFYTPCKMTLRCFSVAKRPFCQGLFFNAFKQRALVKICQMAYCFLIIES